MDRMTAKEVKEKITSFSDLSDAFDWLKETGRLKYFAWFLSKQAAIRAGLECPIGCELHHIIPVRTGLTKEILLNPKNFKFLSFEEHDKLEEKGK